jgi:hypothetical protein
MPPLIALMALMAPEDPLHEDAQVAYLVGKQPSQSGAWIEVFVYRARRMVHVYRLESHGRRHYRSLIYTSDARICLHEMQPSTEHRRAPWTPVGAARGWQPVRRAGGGPVGGDHADFDDEELVLLDLLHAPPDSYLYSLATVMARVESLSHVLAWARYDEMARLHTPEAVTQSDLHLVSLPRLKLTFEAREVHGSVRLYSVDHADLFIINQRNEASSMLAGIPHSLLLSNSNDELSVLVPAWPPCRPAVDSVPFSTELVLDRSSRKWYDQLEHPYYMYPVHVSLSFLYSTTLASALYLLLLRYLNRQYKAVVRLVDTVGTDSALTKEGRSLHLRHAPRCPLISIRTPSPLVSRSRSSC